MARIARIVYPHHVTQRGNRRQQTFFSDEDYHHYIELLSEAKKKVGIEVWAYCLMPNHVHLVVVPKSEDSLARFFTESHRQYTRRINFRQGWRGHLWQERFHSFVMDEHYLLVTVCYTELNPVRAGLCDHPQDWEWSSVHAHLRGHDDNLVTVAPMLERIAHWASYLERNNRSADKEAIRKHTRTGRPVQEESFLMTLKEVTGMDFRKHKPGPKQIIK